MDIQGDYAGQKFASQLHLHTVSKYGMFLGSYGEQIGIISQGSHYSGGGKHLAKSDPATPGAGASSGVIFYDGKTHFFANGGLTPEVEFTPTYTLTIAANGNVGVGTQIPDAKLTVKGLIHAEEVRVDLSVPGPDYVFEPDYALMPLSQLAGYLKVNRHLPEVPSARIMAEEGIQLKEMNMTLLKKVEELTLYVIELQKENERQNEVIKQLVDDSKK